MSAHDNVKKLEKPVSKFKRGKMLNAPILSVRELKTVQGVFGNRAAMIGNDDKPKVGNYGQPLWTFELTDLETGEVNKYWGDGGLDGSFKMAKVVDGAKIEIEHTGEKELDNGKVQTYAIYPLEG